MKIVIIGAGGLVGLNLLSMIKGDIIAIDKNKNNLGLAERLFGKKIICADVSRKGKWEDALRGADCVISLQAQISSPDKRPYVRNNIDSVRNVIDACRKHKIRHLIHMSSSVVISVADDNYTNTKREGENLVKDSEVPHTILRPPLLYGLFDIKHLGYLTRLLELSPVFPVPGDGRYMRQPLYVKDLCKVIIKCTTRKPEGKVYDIIGKERIDFINLIKIIARQRRLRRLYIKIPIPIFVFLLKTYSLITGKRPFVPEQLKALIAGDDFPLCEWEKEFKVSYTPFAKGIKETINSELYKIRFLMR